MMMTRKTIEAFQSLTTKPDQPRDRTQTQNLKKPDSERRKHSKTEPKIFAPPQTPFPGARDGQNLISWRWSLPKGTNPVLVRIDARNFELSW